MGDFVDYYKILGIKRIEDNDNADRNAIKNAAKKLKIEYHPDKNPGDKVAAQKLKEVLEAEDRLTGPGRADYIAKHKAYYSHGGTSSNTSSNKNNNNSYNSGNREHTGQTNREHSNKQEQPKSNPYKEETRTNQNTQQKPNESQQRKSKYYDGTDTDARQRDILDSLYFNGKNLLDLLDSNFFVMLYMSVMFAWVIVRLVFKFFRWIIKRKKSDTIKPRDWVNLFVHNNRFGSAIWGCLVLLIVCSIQLVYAAAMIISLVALWIGRAIFYLIVAIIGLIGIISDI